MWHLFKKEKAKVVYSHEYFYGIPEGNSRQTFDVMKYKKIRDKLVQEKIVRRNKILRPEMVSYEDMNLVHTKSFLESIKNPLNVAQYLKLDYVNAWDSYILEYFRVVAGGTLLATEYALNHCHVVFNLGGGFHHAQAEKADGFCLINDAAIAVMKYKKLKKLSRALFIDLDYHQGDGNLLIFKNDPDVYTFSMHASNWQDIQCVSNTDILIPSNCDGATYMHLLETNLPDVFNAFEPEIVFYIAGSDLYEYDTLGDMKLTRQDLLQRNLFVLNLVKPARCPIVILAGGGYGPNSWEIYYDFIRAAILN